MGAVYIFSDAKFEPGGPALGPKSGQAVLLLGLT